MYILVRDDIDLGHAMLACAHGSLGCYLDYQTAEAMQDWTKNSFRKVVCKVTPAEFAEAKKFDLSQRVMTESGLGGVETAIVFVPREDWPPFFKSLKLYK